MRGARHGAMLIRVLIAGAILGLTAGGATASARGPAVATEEPLPLLGPDWAVHLFGGVSAGRSRLIELIPFPFTGDYGDDYLVAAALSRRILRFDRNWSADGEIGVGYRFGQTDAPETWIAVFLRYERFPWNHVVRTTAAVSTGLSYIGTVPDTEKARASDRGNPAGSRLLHYFSPELTFAHPDNPNSEFVVRYHHRSGVFGTFNNVWGGSNVLTGGVRQRF
jgi:hypothetical protein